MSAFVRIAVLVLLFPVAAFAATIKGVVKDPNGQPLAGVTVVLDSGARTLTTADGAFLFEASGAKHTLHVVRLGFQSESATVTSEGTVEITLHPVLADSMVVSGIRAEAETPVTKTTIDRQEIEK